MKYTFTNSPIIHMRIEFLTRYMHLDKLMFYVLVGFDTTFDEDMVLRRWTHVLLPRLLIPIRVAEVAFPILRQVRDVLEGCDVL